MQLQEDLSHRSFNLILVWDFQLPRVKSINVSGHKYGLVYPGLGWIIWREAKDLPEELIFRVSYLGGNMPTFRPEFLPPRRAGTPAILQLPPSWERRVL